MHKEDKMLNIDLDEKIQKFFDSVIETLNMSKNYTKDKNELSKINSNITAVKCIKMNTFYFQQTPFLVLGCDVTSHGFKNFGKNNENLFNIFRNVLLKIFVNQNKHDIGTIDEVYLAIDLWNNAKPKTYMQNILNLIIQKNQLQSKQLVH